MSDDIRPGYTGYVYSNGWRLYRLERIITRGADAGKLEVARVNGKRHTMRITRDLFEKVVSDGR